MSRIQVSNNFYLDELTQTSHRHIPNDPNHSEIINLTNLSRECLEKVRALWDNPYITNSGFRSYRVNRKVGGSKRSQHRFGQAHDGKISGISVDQMFVRILQEHKANPSKIEFDQIIHEFGRWIHISYVKGANRGRITRAYSKRRRLWWTLPKSKRYKTMYEHMEIEDAIKRFS